MFFPLKYSSEYELIKDLCIRCVQVFVVYRREPPIGPDGPLPPARGKQEYLVKMQVNDMRQRTKLIANARLLRRNMTKEERHLWYDLLSENAVKPLSLDMGI